MKQYIKIQTVSSCLNCPNKVIYSSENNVVRCGAVLHRKNTPRLIKDENLQYPNVVFPEWCPLDDE